MTHPDDLLADLVDGSLTGPERAEVDAHLATCARCRDEVALASSARRTLHGLPRAVPVPPEVGEPAVAEAAGAAPAVRDGGTTPGHPRWVRWATGAAAAAAVVLAIAVIVPSLDGLGDGGQEAAIDAATGGGAEAGPPPLERLDGDLDEDDLVGLVDPARDGTLGEEPTAAAPNAAGEGAATETDGAIGAAAARLAAADCVRRSFPEGIADAQPLRLLELRFRGTPAYAGLYPSPLGTDETPRIQVVVASRADCTVLSTLVIEA